jgi:hypothetical protein
MLECGLIGECQASDRQDKHAEKRQNDQKIVWYGVNATMRLKRKPAKVIGRRFKMSCDCGGHLETPYKRKPGAYLAPLKSGYWLCDKGYVPKAGTEHKNGVRTYAELK